MFWSRAARRSSTQITDTSERSAEAISNRLQSLQDAANEAIEQSKRTASAAVSEMMETHGMLRSDTTALFERLREANGLLQDVVGGAQSNLGSIEQILSVRVADFVSTMNNLLERTGATTTSMDEHIGSFYDVTQQVLGNLGDLAQQFDAHGRALSGAVTELERFQPAGRNHRRRPARHARHAGRGARRPHRRSRRAAEAVLRPCSTSRSWRPRGVRATSREPSPRA